MHLGYVLINCELGTEEYVMEELKRIPEVKKAHVTFGTFDIIVEIQAKTQEDFDNIISHGIRNISRVISTMTLKVVNSE